MRRRGGLAIGSEHGGGARLALCALALLLLLVPATAGAGTRGSAPDRRATHAYLLARYEFARAALAKIGASNAALTAFLGRVGGECPGVLAGVPAAITEPRTPAEAAMGERARRQLFELAIQVDFASIEAWYAPEVPATLRFAGTIAHLRWSEPRIELAARRLETSLRAFLLAGAGASLCTDLRSWVQSGYQTLAPGTKAFISRARLAPTTVSNSSPPERSLDEFARRIAGPGDRLLLKRYRRLTAKLRRAVPGAGLLGRLGRELGLFQSIGQLFAPNTGTIFIGRGSTDAGTRFAARAKTPSGGEDSSCGPQISIEETLVNEGGEVHGTSGSGSCSSGEDREPTVRCEKGRLLVQAFLAPGIHSATLTLSDGRQINSPVFEVPAAAGGPGGFYYQAVRGPSPIPLTLSELNEAGVTVAVVRLAPVVECTRHPHKTLSGRRTLVRAHTPGGQSFSIFAERFSELGRIKVTLGLEVARLSTRENLGGPAVAVSWQLASACVGENRVWILYGVLHNPARLVYARSGGRLVALAAVRLPASLHTPGALVYRALASAPSAIVLRDASGRTLGHDSLLAPSGVPHPRDCRKPLPAGVEESPDNASGWLVGHGR